jgi:dTDP-glucose pyrophosphorylase
VNILIPMAGAGSRFAEAGYSLSKPLIPVTDRKTGEKVPMVVAAVRDLHRIDSCHNYIFVDRDFHKASGVEQELLQFFPNVNCITIDYLTEGQASTCLLAKELIDNEVELLIGSCDNGVQYDRDRFELMKGEADALIFTYRNHELVTVNPEAHGWVKTASDGLTASAISVKKRISNNPLADHAIVASFWFRKGSDFVKCTENMIEQNDRINGEFYADLVMQYAIDAGLRVKVLEVERYFCWGTPVDYEQYEKTIRYWKEFIQKESWL